MVQLIRIELDGASMRRADGMLKRIRDKLPEMTRGAMQEWGKVLERDMKHSAFKVAGITSFTGTLATTGIQWRQRPKGNIGILFIRKYGIQLDSMKPHWVNIKGRRLTLMRWGMQARDSLIRMQSIAIASGLARKHAIVVRPHPFIRRGWRIARPKLRQIIRKHLRMVVAK